MQYNVDLTKIMGINVAFDIVDNTDDIEPAQIGVARQQDNEPSLEDQ